MKKYKRIIKEIKAFDLQNSNIKWIKHCKDDDGLDVLLINYDIEDIDKLIEYRDKLLYYLCQIFKKDDCDDWYLVSYL